MSKVYVCMAEGMEEVECLAVVDILVRSGIKVCKAAMGSSIYVTGSHKITVKADSMWNKADCMEYDAIFLPGGMPGTLNLGAHEELKEALLEFEAQGKILAAICAAPTVLGKYGLLNGRKATCYPGMEDQLTGACVQRAGVVRDGNVLTGCGLGFAIDEGLELAAMLEGQETADRVKEKIQHPLTRA